MLSSEMSSPNPYTLEKLIESLDERGLLILQVLVGQRAIAILAEDTKSKIKPKGIMIPDGNVQV